MNNAQEERVRLQGATQAWMPARGDATEALGRYLVEQSKELPDSETFDRIALSSLEILRRCKPMSADAGSRTGLVVGYVQSGKTMSMTTVASLARDNGCRIVILLAGVTENLLKQTARNRIRPYLLNDEDPRRRWRLHDTVDSSELASLREQLSSWVDEWKRANVPEERKRPLFLTIMKNHAHLEHLAGLLRDVDLNAIPCLVLDDEADQAGLDTTAKQRASGKDIAPSTTYQRISAIRRALPNHTYLQYTATPQAPLLISLADMLSPDFAHVLEPGEGYTGGRAFFLEHNDLVVEIPTDDLFDPSAPPDEPPSSLMQAMREFFVGVAAAIIRKEKGPRSMLVHPSQRKSDHDAFWRFTHRIRKSWLEHLRLPEGDSLAIACAEDFREAYEELAKTDGGLPPFVSILEELPHLLSDTQFWKVNSEDGHEVDWRQCYAHILVGGDKLNRGFTVEGLTVTYMPRKPGGWNADTIQQRARFFGYKKSYLGLCRVHLHPEVADAYREYVRHEEDIRAQLQNHQGSLKAWKRHFLLDQRQHPTRANVLSEQLHRSSSDHSFRQNHPHVDAGHVARNRERVAKLIALAAERSGFAPDPRHPSHHVARLPLSDVFDSFVVEYECFGADAAGWAAIAMWLGGMLHDRSDIECMIVNINNGTPRLRSEDRPDRINNLFEGRRASQKAGAYQGDEAFVDPDAVTIQLHCLNVDTIDKGTVHDVPAVAVMIPEQYASGDIVIQNKHGQ